jgi:hypothetical protein
MDTLESLIEEWEKLLGTINKKEKNNVLGI